jgi:ATP-binding cassette subfamily B protein
LALLRPLPLLIAVDSGIGSHPLPAAIRIFVPATISHFSALLLAATLLLAVTFASQLQGLAASLLSTYTGEKLLLAFRSDLFGHMQRLSLLFHDTKGTAESLYRVQYDATAIQSIVVENAVPFISASITVVGMLYVTVHTTWQLALIAVAIAPILFVIGRRYRRGLRAGWRVARVLEK